MSRLTFLSPRFHYTFGPHEPTLRVHSGQSLRIICPDSDNVMSDGRPLTAEQRQRDNESPLMEGNPLAGPIFVEDAEPGDTLAIDIEAIILDRVIGQTGLAPGAGLLSMHQLLSIAPTDKPAGVPKHLYQWEIDPSANVARLSNSLGPDPITVPLDPFVGCVGVCPEWGQSISSLFAGNFGGNMDIPAMRAGSCVMLPVHRSGGLLALGDLHAAQGHGEIIGGAIETSGTVDVCIRLIKSSRIAGPRVRDAKQLMAIASHGDLREAVQTAYARLLEWLAGDLKLNRWDAYNLMSQTGSITMGNLVTSPYSIGAAIPISVLPMSTMQNLSV